MTAVPSALRPLSGKARVAGVIGWPVSHSRSPRLHGYWLAEHGIDGAYVPLPVAADDLETALRGLAAAGLAGVNVTIPHKEAVLALCDSVDDTARRIGAANLLVFSGGRIEGRNTDAFGFMANLKESAPGWNPKAPVLLLGAGGAARAVAVGLIDAGVTELRLCNRNQARAETLATEIGGPIAVLPWKDRAAALDGAGLAVNATSLGMNGQPPLELPLAALSPQAVVADLVYSPLETALLAAARAKGCTGVDGLGMLLHQGRPSFAAWFGVDPQVSDGLRRFVLGEG